jgi:NAD(P)-dependent dehydrogenase (short-subunit alcohol dehydrogenase family)
MRHADEKPVWLVTGAAHGVGRIIAEMALRDGNRVVATTDRLEDLWPLVDSFESMVIPIELDVNDEGADREIVQRVVEIMGRLDVVVNAAGYDKEGSVDDARHELERVQTNLFGALWVSQAALEYMCANAGGRIVQVFGLNSLERHRDRRFYDTSRRMLTEFSEDLAREVAPFGVEVSICVAADLYGEWSDDDRARTYTLDAYDPEGAEVFVELVNQLPADEAEALATANPALTHIQRLGEEWRNPSDPASSASAVIVVGIDGSDTSWNAFCWACGETKRLGGRAVAVFVGPTSGVASATAASFGGAVVAYGAILQTLTDQAEKLSDQVRAYGRDHGVDVAFVHTQGDTAKELLRITNADHADLLVVGHSTKARHHLAGSLGRRLVGRREAPIVVVVP